ncbi:hypothetical protein RF11_09503 [Thelohanellus kitauei]|uniref:Uncharacterized protein n=1 Tax=Thelohanellus kitauei TaxID=669202 RepID=A0A0C2J6W3_THEKT|nr:hypothetical protein RF11_09503 [Thelohanellus kitauei]
MNENQQEIYPQTTAENQESLMNPDFSNEENPIDFKNEPQSIPRSYSPQKGLLYPNGKANPTRNAKNIRVWCENHSSVLNFWADVVMGMPREELEKKMGPHYSAYFNYFANPPLNKLYPRFPSPPKTYSEAEYLQRKVDEWEALREQSLIESQMPLVSNERNGKNSSKSIQITPYMRQQKAIKIQALIDRFIQRKRRAKLANNVEMVENESERLSKKPKNEKETTQA